MTEDARSPSHPRLTVRVRRYLFQLLILGLAVHLLLPQLSTLQHMGQVIRGMALWAVGLAAAAQVASYVGSGYLLKSIVSLVGQRLSIARGMVITLAAFSISLVAGGVVGTVAATYRWVVAKFAIILAGGVGVVEAGMAALYHGLGVPEAVTVVVILAYRVLSFWLPTLFGFPMVPYLQHISNP